MKLSNYNPFLLHQTSISPQLLLMVKLLTIGLVGKNYFPGLPAPFLPFFSFFDLLPPTIFQLVIKVLFIIAALMLLTNQKVRFSCFLLGSIFLIATLASKAYYSNGKFFCAMIYLLTALNTNRERAWLLQFQIIIIYFGSGLNKLFELDWRTGQYFDHWLINIRRSFLYIELTKLVPSNILSIGFSWSTIILEILVLPVMLLVRKWHPIGVWLGIVFHSLAFWLSGLSFGIFFPGMLAAYLVFAKIPTKVVVIGANSFFISRLLASVFKLFNPVLWHVAEDIKNNKPDDLTLNFHKISGTIDYLRLLGKMIIYHPLTYLMLMLMLSLPFLPNIMQHIATLMVLILFFPFYNQVIKVFIKQQS